MAFTEQQPDSFEVWHLRLFFVWLFVYMVLQGQDGFFARTVDRVDSEVLRWAFLNMPLQLALAGIVSFAAGRRPRLSRAAALLNTALVGGHVALSVATA